MSKNLNIAFFVTEFPCISETFILNQVIALRKSGHLVHVFAQRRPQTTIWHQTVTTERLLDITFYLDQMPSSRGRKMLLLIKGLVAGAQFGYVPEIAGTVFKNKSSLSVYNFIPFLDKPAYDVVHAHFGPNGTFVSQLRKLGLFRKAKFVTTFHGYDLDETFAGNTYTNLFETCDLFTVNTSYSKKRLQRLGCNAGRIVLLPAGLPVKNYKRQNAGLEPGALQLVFIGRLIRLKGPHLFVEICRLLKERGNVCFKAIMVGEGEMQVEVQKLIDAYELNSIVITVGAKTQEEVIRYLDDADLFLLPGITVNDVAEAQGLVIQEAQAMKLPVLISDAGGMSDGIIENITGFVLPQHNIEAFVERIEWLANNPETRKQMGAAGREFVERSYDSEQLNRALVQLYQR